MDAPSASSKTRLPRQTLAAVIVIILCIPLTLGLSLLLPGEMGTYAVSMIVILLVMAPFILAFEGRRPQARELVLIAVMVALAVVGRAAFFMLPQFKPMVALVIIAGVALGAESGFLTGSLSAFVSNFMFGQGPWTPWQMFALGLIGFLAGLLFSKGRLSVRRLPLCVFGGLSALILYGFIVDTSSVLLMTNLISWQSAVAIYLAGVPFNLVHAVATVIFLFILAPFMIKKLERVREKYGLLGVEGAGGAK
jgi:uncharacterized membrane protein